MGDEAQVAVRAVLFHDFDQRWRVVLEAADGDDLRTILLPAAIDNVRAAARGVRDRLRTEGLDLGELMPVDEAHDTWAATIRDAETVA